MFDVHIVWKRWLFVKWRTCGTT